MIVRPATEHDSEDVLLWRNDPLTRRMSHNSQPVRREDHESWFATSLKDPKRRFAVCEANSTKLAIVRFDIKGDSALVSINLNPEERGKNLAKPCLQSAIEYLQSLEPGIRSLNAEIKQENIGSQRVFEQVGFVLEDKVERVFSYTLAL